MGPFGEMKMIQLCGLWLNESKKGEKFFSGNLGGAKILVFRNSKKQQGSKQPDYYICLDEKQEQAQANGKPQTTQASAAGQWDPGEPPF